jgi:transcriptional regulator with XRE-family HTH domain
MSELPLFARRLISLRASKAISQAQIADATGLSNSTLSRLEAGTTNPELTTLVTLARFFSCSIDYIAGLTDHPQLLRPGDWLIDLDAHDEIMRDPRNPKASEIVWAAAVPERYSVVGSAEYLRMKREQDAAYKRGRR